MFADSPTRVVARIVTMIRKDARTGSRDQITTYMLVSPVLLGLLLMLLLPVLERAGPGFVVSDGLAEPDLAALRAHGELEIVADRAAVIARVLGRDDVTGVVPAATAADSHGFEVIVQGDEPAPVQALALAVIEQDRAVRSGAPPLAPEPAADRPPLRTIATALTGYCVVVIVGLMLGFVILEEKLTRTSVAIRVSPLQFGEYLAAKLTLALALALVMIIPTVALPLGLALDWLAVFVTVVASLPFALSLGLLVGFAAKDQLGAIAFMKGLMPIWASLPVLGFVLSDAWMWTQWPLANHWGAQGLFHALGDGVGVWTCAGLNFGLGLPVFAGTAWLLRRKLGFADAG